MDSFREALLIACAFLVYGGMIGNAIFIFYLVYRGARNKLPAPENPAVPHAVRE